MLKLASQEIPDFFLFPLCYFITIVQSKIAWILSIQAA